MLYNKYCCYCDRKYKPIVIINDINSNVKKSYINGIIININGN